MKNVKISSKRVVSYCIRKFGLTDEGWVGDCIESIGHALGTLNIGLSTEMTNIDRDVIDWKCYPPCDAEYIHSIEKDGCRLVKIGSDISNPENTPGGTVTLNGYWFNGPYIKFTFQTGKVKIHYDTFYCDEDGFPMIPNSDKLVEALAWHFLSEYLAAGNTHPVFNYSDAEQRWEIFQTRAFNDVQFPSIDDAAKFNRMFTRLMPDLNFHNKSFRELFDNTDSNNDITQFTGTTIQ